MTKQEFIEKVLRSTRPCRLVLVSQVASYEVRLEGLWGGGALTRTTIYCPNHQGVSADHAKNKRRCEEKVEQFQRWLDEVQPERHPLSRMDSTLFSSRGEILISPLDIPV